MIKNYQIFKESINKIIQNSGLDIGVVYFILKDIFREIETMYYSYLNRELMDETEEITVGKKSLDEESANE